MLWTNRIIATLGTVALGVISLAAVWVHDLRVNLAEVQATQASIIVRFDDFASRYESIESRTRQLETDQVALHGRQTAIESLMPKPGQ